jgi:hypothetical protein
MSVVAPAVSSDMVADPWSLPLETLDVSGGELWHTGRLHDYLRRLRLEDPVHWSPTGPTGPYWSVTKFNDIVAVDSTTAYSPPTATSSSATSRKTSRS